MYIFIKFNIFIFFILISDFFFFLLFYFSEEGLPNFEFVDIDDINNTEGTYVCERCWKRFKHKNTFITHVQNCTESEIRYSCLYCDYRATQRIHLHEHIQARHPRRVGQHQCPQCKRRYIHKQSLISHLRHECGQEKPFACEFCDYRAKLKHHLKEHRENVHLRPKEAVPQHACPQCKRRYYHKRHLTNHLRNECGQEPKFQCNFCNYRCKTKTSLHLHIRRLHFSLTS